MVHPKYHCVQCASRMLDFFNNSNTIGAAAMGDYFFEVNR